MSEVSRRYTLKVPVLDGAKELTEVTLRRPVVQDLAVMDGAKGEIAKLVALLVRVSGVNKRTIMSMDVVDFDALSTMASEGFSHRSAPDGDEADD